MNADENQPVDSPEEFEALPFRTVVPDGALTRRGSAALGAKYYAIALVSGTVCCYCYDAVRLPRHESQLNLLATVLFVMVPPAAALGAAFGHNLYKRANSDEPSRPLGCAGWCLVFLCFQFSIVPLYLSHRHRRYALNYDRTTIYLPALYMVTSVFFAVGIFSFDRSFSVGTAMVYAALSAAGACDALLINRIVNLRKVGMLAPPDTEKFQFSLGTLLIFVWGFGAWITGLVMLVRR